MDFRSFYKTLRELHAPETKTKMATIVPTPGNAVQPTKCQCCGRTDAPCKLGGLKKDTMMCSGDEERCWERVEWALNPTKSQDPVVAALMSAAFPTIAFEEEDEEEYAECAEPPFAQCPGCMRYKNDDDYQETRCCRCNAEMCNACYSVSPVEGDDDCYCKRCAQERLDEEVCEDCGEMSQCSCDEHEED